MSDRLQSIRLQHALDNLVDDDHSAQMFSWVDHATFTVVLNDLSLQFKILDYLEIPQFMCLSQMCLKDRCQQNMKQPNGGTLDKRGTKTLEL